MLVLSVIIFILPESETFLLHQTAYRQLFKGKEILPFSCLALQMPFGKFVFERYERSHILRN